MCIYYSPQSIVGSYLILVHMLGLTLLRLINLSTLLLLQSADSIKNGGPIHVMVISRRVSRLKNCLLRSS